ncbi:hypothetical protein ACFLZJ_01900 [Nanoarchaeota archaeon]
MNLKFYLEKLHNSKEFKEFKKENPKSFPCSGFFVFDKEKGDNKFHFDYYVPGVDKLFSFKLEKGVEKTPVERYDKKKLSEISLDFDLDFKEIEQMIVDQMEKEGIKKQIQKIIFSLQKLRGKSFLVGTIFIAGLGMIRVNIDLKKKVIVLFEKKSFFDLMKITRRKKNKKGK